MKNLMTLVATAAITACLWANTAMASDGKTWKPVKVGNDWMISHDGGTGPGSTNGTLYTSEGAARGAADKANRATRQAQRKLDKAERKAERGK